MKEVTRFKFGEFYYRNHEMFKIQINIWKKAMKIQTLLDCFNNDINAE